MRGTLYAIGEIIVFLAIATAIGVAIGVIIGRSRAPRAAAPPASSAAASNGVGELKARIKALEAERATAGGAADRVAALEKELAVAEWQINTLEEEVAKAREGAASSQSSHVSSTTRRPPWLHPRRSARPPSLATSRRAGLAGDGRRPRTA